MSCQLSETFRLRVEDVRALEKALGGDPEVERGLLRLCAEKYGARSLFWLRPGVADQMLAAPEYFKTLAKGMVG
jgi:hypothetical protein